VTAQAVFSILGESGSVLTMWGIKKASIGFENSIAIRIAETDSEKNVVLGSCEIS
jgi:hypothetical protein